MSADPFEHLAMTPHGHLVDLSEGPGVVDFGPPPSMRWVNVTDLSPPVMGRAGSSHGHRPARHQPSSRQRGLRLRRSPVHSHRGRTSLVGLG